MNRRRRTVLACAVGVTVGTAGCAETDPSGESGTDPSGARSRTDPSQRGTARGDASHLGSFVLWNDDGEPHEVTLRVARRSETVLDVTRTLDAEQTVEVPNPISTQGTYDVVAETADGRRATREWRVDSCHSVAFVRVRVTDDGLDVGVGRRTVVPSPTCGDG